MQQVRKKVQTGKLETKHVCTKKAPVIYLGQYNYVTDQFAEALIIASASVV